MEPAEIKKASLKDIQQLLQLVNSAYRGEQARRGWTHEADLIAGEQRTDADELQKIIRDSDSVILIHSEGDRVTGCVHLQKNERALYLGMLSVLPEEQAKGIGKKLLQAAEKHAQQNGCTKIQMTVISVRQELIAWYERNGYQRTGLTQPFHTEERFGIPRQPVEFIVLEKEL